jgi:hypothetical protein
MAGDDNSLDTVCVQYLNEIMGKVFNNFTDIDRFLTELSMLFEEDAQCGTSVPDETCSHQDKIIKIDPSSSFPPPLHPPTGESMEVLEQPNSNPCKSFEDWCNNNYNTSDNDTVEKVDTQELEIVPSKSKYLKVDQLRRLVLNDCKSIDIEAKKDDSVAEQRYDRDDDALGKMKVPTYSPTDNLDMNTSGSDTEGGGSVSKKTKGRKIHVKKFTKRKGLKKRIIGRKTKKIYRKKYKTKRKRFNKTRNT